MSKRAILFSTHGWGGPFQVGGHHLARALARNGYDVLFVAAPLSPPHVLALPFAQHVRMRWGEVWSPPHEDGVRVLAPFTLTPLSARWGADRAPNLAHWPQATVPSLKHQLEKLGFMRPDIALIDGPLQLAGARLAAPRQLVMRMFDRFPRMPGMTPALLALAGEAAREADLVMCSAYALEADALALGARRVLVSPNGVDAAHFATPRPMPAAYANIAAPRAVYVGQTGPLFDRILLDRIARERPGVSFVVIGPPPDRIDPDAPANVHWLGPAPWTDLPAYLQHADVGLIPFDVHADPDYASGVNPLKLYEYLAAGIPVVSTSWPELERIGAPALALALRDDFGAALDRALATPVDRAELAQFAASADWRARVKVLLNMLG